MRRCLPALLFVFCAAVSAQDGAEAQPESARTTERTTERKVNEDDHVRIEELRVRGETRRIVVQPKRAGVSAYEIVPADTDPARAAAGQRVWPVLSF